MWELRTPSALKQAEMLASHTTQKRVVDNEDGLPRYTEMYASSFTSSISF